MKKSDLNKTASIVGKHVDDEEYGTCKVIFDNGSLVTLQAIETGKLFVLPKSLLLPNE